jgi:hypothetical protein
MSAFEDEIGTMPSYRLSHTMMIEDDDVKQPMHRVFTINCLIARIGSFLEHREKLARYQVVSRLFSRVVRGDNECWKAPRMCIDFTNPSQAIAAAQIPVVFANMTEVQLNFPAWDASLDVRPLLARMKAVRSLTLIGYFRWMKLPDFSVTNPSLRKFAMIGDFPEVVIPRDSLRLVTDAVFSGVRNFYVDIGDTLLDVSSMESMTLLNSNGFFPGTIDHGFFPGAIDSAKSTAVWPKLKRCWVDLFICSGVVPCGLDHLILGRSVVVNLNYHPMGMEWLKKCRRLSVIAGTQLEVEIGRCVQLPHLFEDVDSVQTTHVHLHAIRLTYENYLRLPKRLEVLVLSNCENTAGLHLIDLLAATCDIKRLVIVRAENAVDWTSITPTVKSSFVRGWQAEGRELVFVQHPLASGVSTVDMTVDAFRAKYPDDYEFAFAPFFRSSSHVAYS